MSGKSPNRIAAEDIGELHSWIPPEVSAPGRVLSSAEKERRERLRRDSEIIEDVEAEIKLPTAEQLQELTEAAEKDGFERGYQDGFSKGENDGRRLAEEKTAERLLAQVGSLLQVAEALVEPIAEQERALEKLLLEFVVSLSRQVVERELQMDSNHILAAVKAAIQALPVGAGNITVHLNPDDLALVETYAEEQRKDWQFSADTDLLPGGCRIETRDSLVDFSVEKRLEELFRQFRNRQLTVEAEAETASDLPEDMSRSFGAGAADEGDSP